MRTFIIIDRNPLEGKAYEHIIERAYPEIKYVAQAYDGPSGVTLVRDVQPAIAFVDIDTINGLHGIILLRAIRELSPYTCLVLTSLEEESSTYIQNVMQLGITAYFLKPISNRALKSVLEQPHEAPTMRPLSPELSIRKRFEQVVKQIADEPDPCADYFVNYFWQYAQRKQITDIESLQVLSIEYATMAFYYLKNDDRIAILSSAYSRFMENIGFCKGETEFRNILTQYFTVCSNLLRHGDRKSTNAQIETVKSLVASFVNCGDPVTLERIAARVYLNPAYLSRLFKKIEGINFVEYVQTCRLDLAKQLLTETEEPVLSIAVKCGYDEGNSFRRFFKKQTGLSPNDYRFISRQAQ